MSGGQQSLGKALSALIGGRMGEGRGAGRLSPDWWACGENSSPQGRVETQPDANSSTVSRKRGFRNPFCHVSVACPLSRERRGSPHWWVRTRRPESRREPCVKGRLSRSP